MISSNCNEVSNKKLNINDEIVSNLKIKLTNAENKLTDIRLEALSSVHHVDQLKECLDKMKVIIFIRFKNKNHILNNLRLKWSH